MARLALLGALLALLAACGGEGESESGEAAEAGPVDIQLAVVTGPAAPAVFEVRCGPAGGTTPDPAETCASIAGHPEMLAPPAMTSSCPGNLGNPPEVRVGGTAAGKAVDLAVRECDEPEERADAARLWLEAAGLSSD